MKARVIHSGCCRPAGRGLDLASIPPCLKECAHTCRQCRSNVSACSSSMPPQPGAGESWEAMAWRECLWPSKHTQQQYDVSIRSIYKHSKAALSPTAPTYAAAAAEGLRVLLVGWIQMPSTLCDTMRDLCSHLLLGVGSRHTGSEQLVPHHILASLKLSFRSSLAEGSNSCHSQQQHQQHQHRAYIHNSRLRLSWQGNQQNQQGNYWAVSCCQFLWQ